VGFVIYIALTPLEIESGRMNHDKNAGNNTNIIDIALMHSALSIYSSWQQGTRAQTDKYTALGPFLVQLELVLIFFSTQ
jgi:hypothetical protein